MIRSLSPDEWGLLEALFVHVSSVELGRRDRKSRRSPAEEAVSTAQRRLALCRAYRSATAFSRELDESIRLQQYARVGQAAFSVDKQRTLDFVLAHLSYATNFDQLDFSDLLAQLSVLSRRANPELLFYRFQQLHQKRWPEWDAPRRYLFLELLFASLMPDLSPLTPADQANPWVDYLREYAALCTALRVPFPYPVLERLLRHTYQLQVNLEHQKRLTAETARTTHQTTLLADLTTVLKEVADTVPTQALTAIQQFTRTKYLGLVTQNPESVYLYVLHEYNRTYQEIKKQTTLTPQDNRYHAALTLELANWSIRLSDYLNFRTLYFRAEKYWLANVELPAEHQPLRFPATQWAVYGFTEDEYRVFLYRLLECKAVFDYYTDSQTTQAMSLMNGLLNEPPDKLALPERLRLVVHLCSMYHARMLLSQAQQVLVAQLRLCPELKAEPYIRFLETFFFIQNPKTRLTQRKTALAQLKNELEAAPEHLRLLHAVEELIRYVNKKSYVIQEFQFFPVDWFELLDLPKWQQALSRRDFYYTRLVQEWESRRRQYPAI